MPAIRRLVLDILKPHDPSLLTFTDRIGSTDHVTAATASLIEHDQEVQNVKLTVEGDDLDYDTIEAVVGELGGTVHSVDQVACGERVVEDRPTLQD